MQNPTYSKYSTNITNTFPCVNEDFEAYANGLMPNGNGWTAVQTSTAGFSHICSNTAPTTSSYTSAVNIVQNSFDPICGVIGNFPLGGSRVAKLNSHTMPFTYAKISQTFPITTTNWVRAYTYKGVLGGEVHGCCEDPYIMIRVLDAFGNPIGGLTHTVVMGTPSLL